MATFKTAALAVPARHSITAVYGGTSNFKAAPRPPSPRRSRGQQDHAAILARHFDLRPGGHLDRQPSPAARYGHPTGTVTFMDGAATLGTATLSSGKATLTTALLASAATPSPPSMPAAPLSPAAPRRLDADREASRDHRRPHFLGRHGAVRAVGHLDRQGRRRRPGLLGAPSGTVTFKDGTTVLGTGTLSKGVAVFQTAKLAVGSHAITVVYGGAANFLSSTSVALTETINKAATTVALYFLGDYGAVRQVDHLDGQDQRSRSGGGPAQRHGHLHGRNHCAGNGNHRQRRGPVPVRERPSKGKHTLTVLYNGDANLTGSTSAALTETIS